MAQTLPDAEYGSGLGSAVGKRLPEELMEYVICLSAAILWLHRATTTEIGKSCLEIYA